MKKGFTLIEIIFVLVIIGILAGIALPKLGSQVKNANITKIKSEIIAIRNGINSKLNTSILADNAKCPDLEGSNDNLLFDNVTEGIKSSDQGIKWSKVDDTHYKLEFNGESTTFEYKNDLKDKCSFTCNSSDNLCKEINE